MKKIFTFLCALVIVLSASAAPARNAGKKTRAAKDFATVMNATPKALNVASKDDATLFRAPKAEAIDVECGSWEIEDWGTDGELYLYAENNNYVFYFDINYGDGASDLVLGKTYTVDDIYVGGDGMYAGVFYDGEWNFGLKDLSLVKTIDEKGLVHFVGSCVDSLDAAFTFHYDDEYTVMRVNFPKENAPEAVEIIGNFDGWQGTAMELLDNGWYLVELEAKASQFFKFRSAGSWDQELEVYDAENDEWRKIKENELVFGQLWQDDTYKGTPCKIIELDLSNPDMYRWAGYYLTVTCDNTIGRVIGSGRYDIDTQVTFSAIPNKGYHFTQWNDSVTDNPRTIVLTQDTTFTAEFAKNTYTISTTSANPEWGTTAGDTAALYLDEVEISAIPNYGYHFVKWDIEKYQEHIEYGSLLMVKFSVPETWSNPYAWIWETGGEDGHWETLSYEKGMYVYRTEQNNMNIIVVPNGPEWDYGQTNDLAITESCCYTINGEYEDSNNSWTNSNYATTKNYDCFSAEEQALIDNLDTMIYVDTTATIVTNPLSLLVTQNQKAIAYFAKNVYSITKNAEHGTISGNTSAEYLDEVTLTANPDLGYHFTQWSDGNKENPRTIVLTQDTTFTAEIVIDRIGTCGDDNALIWTYDAETKTLTITGNGTLNSNYTFGLEAPTEMQTLIIGNEITAIGDSAFYGMSTINHLIIGGSVATIGNYAFAECRNFDDITCLANVVPVINETTFANVGNKQYIYLFVPAERERVYHRDTFWGEFDIQVQQAEGTIVTTNDVTVEPQDNAATVTWPTNDNAASYTIEITKDGVLFCTLTFNANGQLTGIAFAPSRDGHAHAPAAVMTANGLQFTVTGLNSNTQYGYNLIVKDANNQPIATYSGEFTTTGEIATGIDNIQGNEVQSKKFVRDGQIFILRGDKIYTLTGQEIIVP